MAIRCRLCTPTVGFQIHRGYRYHGRSRANFRWQEEFRKNVEHQIFRNEYRTLLPQIYACVSEFIIRLWNNSPRVSLSYYLPSYGCLNRACESKLLEDSELDVVLSRNLCRTNRGGDDKTSRKFLGKINSLRNVSCFVRIVRFIYLNMNLPPLPRNLGVSTPLAVPHYFYLLRRFLFILLGRLKTYLRNIHRVKTDSTD